MPVHRTQASGPAATSAPPAHAIPETGARQSAADGAQPALEPATWHPLAADHRARVDGLLRSHRRRVASGQRHPVEDFMFSYYRLRPAHLRRWYPGLGVALADAPERLGWPFHRMVVVDGTRAVTVDGRSFVHARRLVLDLTVRLLRATQNAPAQFGCFGLHEWAMVYQADPAQLRHAGWPLRLGAAGTDEVVRSHQIRCTHFDAYRFFTAAARPRNALVPTSDARVGLEQPGCLHAAMDVYKWAYKMIPAVPSDLLLDAFELAREIRELDMRASPYDLSALGYPAVPIETADGKAAYVSAQRRFSVAAGRLRERLLDALVPLAAT